MKCVFGVFLHTEHVPSIYKSIIVTKNITYLLIIKGTFGIVILYNKSMILN
jgi:hypothetical protein